MKHQSTEHDNFLNISLEQERRLMDNWNKNRAINEANGLAKFYKLKETFSKMKQDSNNKIN